MKVPTDYIGYDGNDGNDGAEEKAIVGNDTPTPVTWTEDYAYDGFIDKCVKSYMATCPTCKRYPLYGENPCPYCGQALIIDVPQGEKPKKPRTTTTGVKVNRDGEEICERCGAKKISFVGLLDGEKFFGTAYRCDHCGNEITVTTERVETDGEYIF